MDNQYINCSKCGTRNFADDKVCGICKTNLSIVTKQSNQNQSTPKISRGTWFIIISIAIVFYVIFFGADKKKEPSSNGNYNINYLVNSPETQLAIINDQTKNTETGNYKSFC